MINVRACLRVLCLGLENAGKTCLVASLVGQEPMEGPTIGFTMEEMIVLDREIRIWEVGGSPPIRKMWHYYYEGNDAVLFLVPANANSRSRSDAKEELERLAREDKLNGTPLVLVVSKVDQVESDWTKDGFVASLCLADDTRERLSSVCVFSNGDFAKTDEVRTYLESLVTAQRQEFRQQIEPPKSIDTERFIDLLITANVLLADASLHSFVTSEDREILDVAPFVPCAVCFGREGNEERSEEAPRALPHEVISIITSYVPFEELFPSSLWYFSRGKAGGRVWAAGKTWLYAALHRLQQAVVIEPDALLDRDDIEDLVKSLFRFNAPPSLVVFWFATCSCLITDKFAAEIAERHGDADISGMHFLSTRSLLFWKQVSAAEWKTDLLCSLMKDDEVSFLDHELAAAGWMLENFTLCREIRQYCFDEPHTETHVVQLVGRHLVTHQVCRKLLSFFEGQACNSVDSGSPQWRLKLVEPNWRVGEHYSFPWKLIEGTLRLLEAPPPGCDSFSFSFGTSSKRILRENLLFHVLKTTAPTVKDIQFEVLSDPEVGAELTEDQKAILAECPETDSQWEVELSKPIDLLWRLHFFRTAR